MAVELVCANFTNLYRLLLAFSGCILRTISFNASVLHFAIEFTCFK